MGTGTVARPKAKATTRERPATPTKTAVPPTKRARTQARPGTGKKLGRPKKVVPKPRGLNSLPPEIIGRIASFLLPSDVNIEDGFLHPWELPYRAARTKSAQSKPKEYKFGGIPSGVRDVLNLAMTCKRCDSGVSLVIGKIGDGKSDGKKRYVE